MEQHLRNYLFYQQLDNSTILGKRKGKLLLGIVKKDSKNILESRGEINRVEEPSLQLEQTESKQCKQKKCLRGNLPRPRHIYLGILLPYLDNPSEEVNLIIAIFSCLQMYFENFFNIQLLEWAIVFSNLCDQGRHRSIFWKKEFMNSTIFINKPPSLPEVMVLIIQKYFSEE